VADSWRSLKLMFTLQSWAFSDFTMPEVLSTDVSGMAAGKQQAFHGTPQVVPSVRCLLHLVVVYLAYLTARRLLRDDGWQSRALIFALASSK